jgi:hypothetical protein
MRGQRFVDLFSHRHDRIQTGLRLLENHRQTSAAHLAHLGFGQREQIFIAQVYRPPATRPPSGSKRISASAVSDLPQPDSPSKATHSLAPIRS